MNADIPLDEVVTQNKYPNRQDGRQQNRQTPQEITSEASGYRHFFRQQSFDKLPTSPYTTATQGKQNEKACADSQINGFDKLTI
jgi:hypothetical protein